jgi:hypothetical protein
MEGRMRKKLGILAMNMSVSSECGMGTVKTVNLRETTGMANRG